jgi:hypothetical protein
VPPADGEVPLPVDALPAEVARAVLDGRAGPILLRLHPPRHHVVVTRRRATLPVKEVVAILGSLLHVQVERHEGIGPFLDRDLRPIDLDPELLCVEHVVPVDRKPAGVITGVDDVRDDLNVPRLGTFALAAELAEVAGFEVGSEEDLGGRRAECGKGA